MIRQSMLKTASLKQIIELIQNIFGSPENAVEAIKQYKEGETTASIFDKAKTWLLITLIATFLGMSAEDVMANPDTAVQQITSETQTLKTPSPEIKEVKQHLETVKRQDVGPEGRVIWESSKMPEWVNYEQFTTEDGQNVLIEKSDKYSTERDARDDANRKISFKVAQQKANAKEGENYEVQVNYNDYQIRANYIRKEVNEKNQVYFVVFTLATVNL